MILVVDDDDDVRSLAVEMLADAGYEVVAARDATEGLAAIETNPAISLLFTDIVMPGIDGWELAKRAKKVRPDLRVLYTSGFARNMTEGHRGFGPLLPKPWRAGQLRDYVKAAYNGKER